MILISECCNHTANEEGNCSNCNEKALFISREGFSCFGCGEFQEKEISHVCPFNEVWSNYIPCNCCSDCKAVCMGEMMEYNGCRIVENLN